MNLTGKSTLTTRFSLLRASREATGELNLKENKMNQVMVARKVTSCLTGGGCGFLLVGLLEHAHRLQNCGIWLAAFGAVSYALVVILSQKLR